MDQEFINLMNLLLFGTSTPPLPPRTLLNPDYATDINNHVVTLNTNLAIKPCDDAAFISEAPCLKKVVPNPWVCNFIGKSNYPTIGPVPFASSGAKPVFAFFGLNPLFGSNTCEEKYKAGNNLTDYAAFYNSKSCSSSGVFPFVILYSDYYKNLFMIFNSILCKSFISVADFSTKFNNLHPGNTATIKKARKDARVEHCISLIKACPIIVPELVPFHSPTAKINIATLNATMPIYQQYHIDLLNVLDTRMHPDGVIFAHGSATSKALRIALTGKLINVKNYPNSIKTTHTLATWKGRIVIILNSFLRSRGAFNEYDAIKALLNDILTYMGGKSIPCDCPNMKLPDQHVSQQILISQSDTSNKNLEQKEERKNQIQEDVKPVRNKRGRGEVGKVLEAFSDDSKGLLAGQLVEFPERRKEGAKLIEGKIHHILLHADSNVEEAKIIVDNGTKYGKKYYRELHEIEKVENY